MSDEAEPITRDSLEEALKGLQSEIDRDTPDLLTKVAYGASAAALALIGLAYLFGWRKGRRRSTVVEVRRL